MQIVLINVILVMLFDNHKSIGSLMQIVLYHYTYIYFPLLSKFFIINYCKELTITRHYSYHMSPKAHVPYQFIITINAIYVTSAFFIEYQRSIQYTNMLRRFLCCDPQKLVYNKGVATLPPIPCISEILQHNVRVPMKMGMCTQLSELLVVKKETKATEQKLKIIEQRCSIPSCTYF